MKQISRTRVMNRFRSGEVELLVATDVAARGIDVDNIEVVINYDLPQDEEYYVHRIGRTARAGRSGKAYTFVVGREIFDLKSIQRFTRSNIICTQPPSLVQVTETRVFAILDKTRATLTAGGLDSYLNAVEQFVSDLNATESGNAFYTTADVAAALVQQSLGQKLLQTNEIEPVVPYEAILARNKKPGVRQSAAKRFAGGDEDRDFQAALMHGNAPGDDDDLADSEFREKKKRKKKLEPGMIRLFLNVGTDDQIQPAHIVKAICSSTSLTGKQIGAIALYGRYTFVDVPVEAAAQIVTALSGQKIGNRPVRVEISAAGKDALVSVDASDKTKKSDKAGKISKSKNDYYKTGKTGKGSRSGYKDDYKKQGKSGRK
jgi:ATP-dependent RNA helicase DeaD